MARRRTAKTMVNAQATCVHCGNSETLLLDIDNVHSDLQDGRFTRWVHLICAVGCFQPSMFLLDGDYVIVEEAVSGQA